MPEVGKVIAETSKEISKNVSENVKNINIDKRVGEVNINLVKNDFKSANIEKRIGNKIEKPSITEAKDITKEISRLFKDEDGGYTSSEINIIKNANEKLYKSNLTEAEINLYKGQKNMLQGAPLERAVNNVMKKKGFTEINKGLIKLPDGQETKTDYYGINNTKKDIVFCEKIIKPKETVSIECKVCESKSLYQEFKESKDLPKQLSIIADHKFLITTKNIENIDFELVNSLCKEKNVFPVKIDLSASEIKERISKF